MKQDEVEVIKNYKDEHINNVDALNSILKALEMKYKDNTNFSAKKILSL